MGSSVDFQPHIPASESPREFTIRAIVAGTILGIIFGASSLYLVLKVGLTVSASIPVAVISMAIFRLWSRVFGGRDATILEHNITQTAGSAGESLAFGVGVCMPAILILGFDLEIMRVTLVTVLGGLLGILMMIPLRRALIVQQHTTLKYPEGTACAAVLKAGEGTAASSAGAKAIFTGFGIGLLYKVANIALKAWRDVPEKVFGPPLKTGSISCEISPELLGVGYIIGPRIAALMAAGGVMSYLLLIPMIKFFGENMTAVLPPGDAPISEMSGGAIRGAYVLYIGAGAVAAGGIVSLIRAIPTIWHGIKSSISDFSPRGGHGNLRTQRDLPMKLVLIGCVVLLAAITFATPLHMNLLGALLILVCGFIFVTVSSRLTGEIGSSSNPISGMTIATLLLTCLVFLLVGWTGNKYYVTALSVGAIVCIASAVGGATSQDLKTGFLLGGTPRLQQIAILIGATASAFLLGPILLGLNNSATVYQPVKEPIFAPANALIGASTEKLSGPQAKSDSAIYRVWHRPDPAGGSPMKYLVDNSGKTVWIVDPGINGTVTARPDGSEVSKFAAPKATLISYIIKGILDQKLPWELVLFGVMISLTLELAGAPSLAFAVGVYLPISSSMPIFVGGVVRWLVDKFSQQRPGLTEEERIAETDKSPGVLLASGYIAGGAIAGIVIAFLAGVTSDFDTMLRKWAEAHNPFFAGPWSDALSLIPYAAIVIFLFAVGRRKRPEM
ncbi:MAG TPA: oligopeptide transporter, OPT family [Chthoniobacterales bacterium]